MAIWKRHEVINAMYKLGLVPIFYENKFEVARSIVKACFDGGARVIEFTNRGEFAYKVFAELAEFFAEQQPEIILGVGSVIDVPTAAVYLNNGANFVVGPLMNPDVARLCNRRKVCYIPGCGTVREISEAEELGVEIVKFFPAGVGGGPGFVKAVRQPLPWVSIMPTGGVEPTYESIEAWFTAGATCVGIGSKLISKPFIDRGDWEGLKNMVQECLAIIGRARAK